MQQNLKKDGTCPLRKQQLIEQLKLVKHAEGGHFIRTFCSEALIKKISSQEQEERQQPCLSAIYYLLTKESPIGHFVYNKSAINHYFQEGKSMKYYVINAKGELDIKILGNNIENGEFMQIAVEGGCWKANELINGEYGLLGEAVAPAFDYNDSKLGNQEQFKQEFPDIYDQIKHLVYSDHRKNEPILNQ